MASLLFPVGSASVKSSTSSGRGDGGRVGGLNVRCSNLEMKDIRRREYKKNDDFSIQRRGLIGLVFGSVSSSIMVLVSDNVAKGAGLPPEEKPRLCDQTCEKELENVPMVTTESGLQYKDIKVGAGPSPPIGFQVAANYVAMVPSGQIFDSSLEKGQIYIFRVGSGQVIKGLDEGILSMKAGGKRRIYVPGSLAFPKGLNSAPGRPRVAPNSPVIFDVSLEYIPGLEMEEE
ncbi:peptidyl-prolyl cis-trans isomerase FKBP16-3, chloroplastic [Mercurialis annua]|uniref:peptidyl-prolyl cis-trans isomerase FKBP16-3, chloroplastic n=1 Tax=Mercurialis annua TaxID=3986 RepID=UPI00215E50D4|nr:peptidyl-prolyl cis-trans isomerase FKBP16-3, chloroplastic [Mercurialis annua]XP_050206482.1 peptidyl-prolyl cis-trans isomerase FKBP16-3, chloroplastic [Mercurialis annua]